MKIYSRRDASRDLPQRKKSANKSDSGLALVVAGSKGMWGAAVLSCTAAARVGAGYVTLAGGGKNFPIVKHPDFLFADAKKLGQLKFSVAAIGPGLGDSARARRLLLELVKTKNKNVVADADALNLTAKYNIAVPAHWIITPHEGELARLLQVSATVIRKQREKYVRLAQKKLGCVVLLKGRHTLIAAPGKLIQISSGNQALAKAGTGDVLTGMICGFLAQGLQPVAAASLAAFVHGYMADRWIRKKDILSLMASDLLMLLPETLKELRK